MTVSRSRVIGLIVVVFVAIGAFLGYNGYKAFFGGIDSDYKEQISREMESITENIRQELDLPEQIPAEPVPVPETESPETPPAQPAPPEPAPIAPDPDRIQAIIHSYEGGLATLQTQGNSVIDGLIGDAKADYQALVASGAGKTELLNLAVSYMGKATAMEKEVDAGFNALMTGLSEELKAAGMPKEEIDAYVAELKAAYKIEKDGRRKALLDKAKSYL
ncbi:MAG: hypothetical protein GXY56_08725 [Clostridiales bacterium]|nr:hypothetical protein [Clostridiales bacterium]HPF19699.1 hypothetical protein [Bacillota bacterium]